MGERVVQRRCSRPDGKNTRLVLRAWAGLSAQIDISQRRSNASNPEGIYMGVLRAGASLEFYDRPGMRIIIRLEVPLLLKAEVLEMILSARVPSRGALNRLMTGGYDSSVPTRRSPGASAGGHESARRPHPIPRPRACQHRLQGH